MSSFTVAFLFILVFFLCRNGAIATNHPPVFTKDMNGIVLSENIPVGTVVYTLHGIDPENSTVTYGLFGTDRFIVNPTTGEVTLAEPLDREVSDELVFTVSIEDVVDNNKLDNNNVTEKVSVIVSDENDNAPEFKNSPFEADVLESATIGTTVLKDIIVEDKDILGETIEVECIASPQWADACTVFNIVIHHHNQSQFSGSLILKAPLNYNIKHSYQFQLRASDGTLTSTAGVEIRIVDIQNLPPVFTGSLAAVLNEDVPIGTHVLTIHAKDGDRAHPRNISYDLISDPYDYFVLDSVTGELRTGKSLDREALVDSSAPINLTVRAREIVDNRPVDSELTSSVATVTITLRDVNDEPPRFNRKEYFVEIPENIPFGTPLPNLDMSVTDTDLGQNSAFSLRLNDPSKAFIIEPKEAIGSTQVSIRLSNITLDYEDPNQRKFIILVIAEELNTNPPLSSTSTVTVTVTDVNDNPPVFKYSSYNASVSEQATPGTSVMTITASDRDHTRFGTEGIVYELSGSGSELFIVDNRTGVITVAPCETPGKTPCLDFESRREFFLNYKAIDADGSGQSTGVPLKISLYDTNDNPPKFRNDIYKASIDEGASKFDPELRVQATDLDESSVITYSIIDGTNTEPFKIDGVTGKIDVKGNRGLDMSNVSGDHAVLIVEASDGKYNSTCVVEITVLDVNNNAPIFETKYYNASVSEDAELGTEVITVKAHDNDSGTNAIIKYSIQKGAFDDFSIEKDTGIVTVSADLDYDKRHTYQLSIMAVDQGSPSLTGTTLLTITVLNENDKLPYFLPQTQRTEVSANAAIGDVIHKLIAVDPDVKTIEDLKFQIGIDPITAVDKNGKQVPESSIFKQWFFVENDGRVKVARQLDRNIAAVITLPVSVTDISAPRRQISYGSLIITIVDVNTSPPTFRQSQFTEKFLEELPPNTTLATFHATDSDSSISHYAIEPPNSYFQIDNITGIVKSTQKIDYESIHQINFTVVAYDTGVPPLSTSANVTVNIINTNDEQPVFVEELYSTTLLENSPGGTSVLRVHAEDKDEGLFGEIKYSFSDPSTSKFTIDADTGEIKVANGAIIDREEADSIWLRVKAVDTAPLNSKKESETEVHIKVLDMNDNSPIFAQHTYKAFVADNLPLDPPATILQVTAEDKDAFPNSQIRYSIVDQTEEGAFRLDPVTGILYPASPLKGNTTYHLKVSATDGNGEGPNSDTATIDINVESINQHTPIWVVPDRPILEISENLAEADVLLLTLNATDEDPGKNGEIKYYIKVGNKNVHETNEFSLDEITGELRTRVFLDREARASYQLFLVAMDQGSPSQLENITALTISLTDANDNKPEFQKEHYEFSVLENQDVGITIGVVKASDKDEGENGKVFYHIVHGNDKGCFGMDRTQGVIKSKCVFDREEKSEYSLTIFASNEAILKENGVPMAAINPDSVDEASADGILTYKTEVDKTMTLVTVKILDENDNPPKFEKSVYHASVGFEAKVNEFILSVKAYDPDFGSNGTISYSISASNLYKFGSKNSIGSIVSSPFNITQEGSLVTANDMVEYNQDRFILNIIAMEVQQPYRQATADVHVWIVTKDQLIKIIFNKPCNEVNKLQNEVTSRLSNATKAIVVVNAIRGQTNSKKCDFDMTFVDPDKKSVLMASRVIDMIDAQYDQLKDFYENASIGIDKVIPALSEKGNPEPFDPASAALIALLIVLFVGIVTFIVVCSCLKQWVLPLPTEPNVAEKGSVRERSRRLLQELSSTENPLWAEHKLRLYEEQELTMNVFGENNEGSPENLAPVDNTYATIQGSGERDYATLNSPRASLPTMSTATMQTDNNASLEVMLGFQGSTFQPEIPPTPEPPPRVTHYPGGGS